jgi:hypothetical protein
MVPAGAAGQDLMNTPIGFRSGFTEGAATTRPGTLAVNVGATVRWAQGTRTYRFGELNVRVPVSRRVEGRLYANSYAWRRNGSGLTAGREDLSVGAAAMVVSHRGLRPVAALIVRLDTPTGTLPGRERSWRPSALWSLGWELPGRVALHGNLGIARETRGVADYSRGFASVWLSRHLAGPFGAYAEVYGSNRERPAGPSTHYLHGAITCRVRSWMHFDLHAGLGSADAGSPRWIGIGVRQRIAR